MGRATKARFRRELKSTHFNPRPPWGGRQAIPTGCYAVIHNFNPRPPWGGRLIVRKVGATLKEFQSTPSVGRATASSVAACRNIFYFNPRPPWGGRPRGQNKDIRHKEISIHALRGEGDCKNIQICNAMLVHSAYKTIYFCDSCAFYLT